MSDSKSALRSDAEVQQKPAGYGDPAETPEVEPNDPPEFKREAPPLDLDDVGPALDVNEGKEHPAPSSTSGSDSH